MHNKIIGTCASWQCYGHIGLLAKKIIGHTPFWLAYGLEVMMPMEYIVPSLHMEDFIGMADSRALE